MRPGEVVTASVENPLENPGARGKIRPVVLVDRDGARWLVMGLTTNRQYSDGNSRTAVPSPGAVGLTGPGFLWGRKLTPISVFDVHRHLGWIDYSLAALIIEQAHLGPGVAADLVRSIGAAAEVA